MLIVAFAIGFFSGIAIFVGVVWLLLHKELGPPPTGRPEGWQ